jgi:hypothetical protein
MNMEIGTGSAGTGKRNGKPDPQRDRLRLALDAQRKAADAAARHQAAIAAMVKDKAVARRAADAAKTEIDIALAGHAAAIAAAAASGDPAPATSGVRLARNREQDKADEAQALDAALGRLRAELPELRAKEAAASRAVEMAIVALFEPLASSVLERALVLHQELAPLVAGLSALFASDIGRIATDYGVPGDVRGEVLNSIRRRMACFFGSPSTPLDGQPWRAARAALLVDPDADLPDLQDVRDSSR